MLLQIVFWGGFCFQHDAVVDFLLAQNWTRSAIYGKKPVDRLTVKGHALRLSALRDISSMVMPETILRWRRQLIAQKWDTRTNGKTNRGVHRLSRRVWRWC